ncbi:MAG: 3-deoxy-7-phosphoheptulonate synthase [Flavobacteriaceae bacterium]|nr:MAG: 3-deoxy-7-phosphoheptulonate synthase [Flavobacteriaceae bacterium]
MKLEETKQDWIKAFGDKPLAIAGPCSAESQEQVLRIAHELDKDYVKVFRAGIWKPRTKPGSFEGIGEIGLKWLQKVKEETGLLVSTEVASAEHVRLALEYGIDILWIGARTTVNPFLVQEIAEAIKNYGGTDKIVLVKNPVNPDLDLWIGALERLLAQGVTKLGVIQRGFSSYIKTKYRNNPQWQIVLDFKSRYPNIPVIVDPSHICGNRTGIQEIIQQGFNFEFEGTITETHYDPDNAWSDAAQQIVPARLLEILKETELRKHSGENSKYDTEISHLRSEIDQIDGQIWDLINARMGVVSKIGKLKKEYNVAVYQPERWEEIIKKSKEQASAIGLNPEFVEKIIKEFHQESLNIQNKIMS